MTDSDAAKELTRIAQFMVADYGDVRDYWNVSDFFEAEDGLLQSDDVELLQGILHGAISRARRNLRQAIAKELKRSRADIQELDSRGIKLK